MVVSGRRFGTTYRSHLPRSSSPKNAFFLTAWPLKMGPIDCPETSVRYYHSTLRKIPKERRSHLHLGGSLKSRIPSSNSVWVLVPLADVLEYVKTSLHAQAYGPLSTFGQQPFCMRFEDVSIDFTLIWTTSHVFLLSTSLFIRIFVCKAISCFLNIS